MFDTGLEGDSLIGQTHTELGHKEPIVQVLYMYFECVVSNDYLLKKGEYTNNVKQNIYYTHVCAAGYA